MIECYIDDAFRIIEDQDHKLWNRITKHIKTINNYYNNNRLLNNIEKTKVMLITKDKKLNLPI